MAVFHLAMRKENLSLFSISKARKYIAIRIFTGSLFFTRLQDHKKSLNKNLDWLICILRDVLS